MDPVLTPRLVLTPVGPDDVDDLILLYSDPEVAYWTGPWTRDAVEVWAADMAIPVDDRRGRQMDGTGSIRRVARRARRLHAVRPRRRDGARARLGGARRPHRPRLCDGDRPGGARLGGANTSPDLPVVAFTEVHNRASRAVMERLGMRPAGIIRRVGLVEGRPRRARRRRIRSVPTLSPGDRSTSCPGADNRGTTMALPTGGPSPREDQPGMTAAAPAFREHGNAYNIFILVLTVLSLVVMVLLVLPLDAATLQVLLASTTTSICVDVPRRLRGQHHAARSPSVPTGSAERGWLDLLGSIPTSGGVPVRRPVPARPPEPAGADHAAARRQQPEGAHQGRTRQSRPVRDRSSRCC